MKEFFSKWGKKYLVSFGTMGAMSVLCLVIREHWNEESISVRLVNLTDAFTIPSVVIVMLGALVWVSTTGFFDMLTYGTRRAANALFPFYRYEYVPFYDYKVKKDSKRITGYSFMFISGGIYFIPAIVFMIIYSIIA